MKLPQLSLRDLFWLVLVVGMGVGWWVDHQQLQQRIRHLLVTLPPKPHYYYVPRINWDRESDDEPVYEMVKVIER